MRNGARSRGSSHLFEDEPANPKVTVRLARHSEAEEIGHMVAEAYTTDRHVEVGSEYELLLRDAEHRMSNAELLVAVDENTGTVLGSVTVALPGSPYADIAREEEGEIRILAVSPRFRRKGLGTTLMQGAIRYATEHGVSRLVLSSMSDMKAAHRIYDRLGFHRFAERDWSPQPGVDLAVYGLDLPKD